MESTTPSLPSLFDATLKGRKILFGVCGSVAAPKAFLAVSELVKLGAEVQVVMSRHAHHFIGAWSFEGVTGKRPIADLFDPNGSLTGEPHITLARWADVFVIMPATDSTIGNLALGLSSDLMVLLAKNISEQRLLIVPAMSSEMWLHPSTQGFVETLQSLGATFIGPEEGRLASGAIGLGRMSEPERVVAEVRRHLGKMHGDLKGLRLVVNAGGCREPIDAVRFISNASSGKQGHALAEAARDRGALVHLITTNPEQAPLSLDIVTAVSSHSEMQAAVVSSCLAADVFIGAAAVSDFTTPKAEGKLGRGGNEFLLRLTPTSDIIGALETGEERRLIKVAFAAEVGLDDDRAFQKMKRKNADLMVLNDIASETTGFKVGTNSVRIFSKSGFLKNVPEQTGSVVSKYSIAWELLDCVKVLL
jgi:phosphopantothenoylcysteine decarboxylase / phosphopantothenate---cysteine ligase